MQYPPLSPRFPLQNPLSIELYRLQDFAVVLHFFAVGKPWTYSPEQINIVRRDAHPLLAEQFRMWRDMAADVCPGGIPVPHIPVAQEEDAEEVEEAQEDSESVSEAIETTQATAAVPRRP